MQNLSEIARQEIEKMIVFGELQINQLYSENKLATMLKLGRTPVREALQSLEQFGMVKIHQRKGLEFLAITPEQQLQLLEVRRYIEPVCIKFAILRGTLEQKKQMLELSELFSKHAESGDEVELLYCLRNIHSLLCEATHNPYFHTALNQIQFFSRRFWFANKKAGDDLNASQLHKNILRAVVVGNEKMAVYNSKLLMEHLTEVCLLSLVDKS